MFLSCKSRNLNLIWHTKWNASQIYCCCFYIFIWETAHKKTFWRRRHIKKMEGNWMHLLSNTFKVHQSDIFLLAAKCELLTGWGFLSMQGETLDASLPRCEQQCLTPVSPKLVRSTMKISFPLWKVFSAIFFPFNAKNAVLGFQEQLAAVSSCLCHS